MSMGARELSVLMETLEEVSQWARAERLDSWTGPGSQEFRLSLHDCEVLLNHALDAAHTAQETAKAVVLQLQEVAQAMGVGNLQEWVA